MLVLRWASALSVLLVAVEGLQLPATAPSLRPPIAQCQRCAAVRLMAKKKKGNSKVSKAADKALAALGKPSHLENSTPLAAAV